MIAASTYDRFRQRVLQRERLADMSRFYRSGFFDELPLYSRYSQIEPLVRDSTSPDAALLNLALEYLEEVLTYGRATRPFLAAITFLDDKDFDYLVPNVLICHGQVRRRLRNLRLQEPSTRFAKRMRETLRQIDPNADFQIFEDTQSVPGHVRVLISRRHTSGKLVNLKSLKRR